MLPRLLPKSCRHNERFLSAQVRLLFQAYLVVLYRPKQGGRQGTAWRSSTLQDVRQNPSPALKESPRMGTEFGCKICMLCADCSFDGSSFFVFNPDSTSIESSKSDSMVQFSNHVLHVAM